MISSLPVRGGEGGPAQQAKMVKRPVGEPAVCAIKSSSRHRFHGGLEQVAAEAEARDGSPLEP